MSVKSIHFLVILGALLLGSSVVQAEAQAVDYERQLREKSKALEAVALEQLEELHDLVNSTGSNNENNIEGTVTSAEVLKFNDVPEEVDRKILAMREGIKAIVMQVASDIEETGNAGTVSVTSGGVGYTSLPGEAQRKIMDFVDAKRQNNVSIMSVHLAVQMFADVNEQLMEQAQRAETPAHKRRLYISQAALVFELSNIVYDILDDASLAGLPALQRIRDESKSRVVKRLAEMNSKIREIEGQVDRGQIEEDFGQRSIDKYGEMIRANQQVIDSWDSFLTTAEQQSEWLDGMKEHKFTVGVTRDMAQFQLETLRDVDIVGNIEPFADLSEMVSTIRDLPLLVLDDDTVLELLGRGATDAGETPTRL